MLVSVTGPPKTAAKPREKWGKGKTESDPEIQFRVEKRDKHARDFAPRQVPNAGISLIV